MVTGLTYSIIPVYIYIEYNGGGTKESPARQAARDGMEAGCLSGCQWHYEGRQGRFTHVPAPLRRKVGSRCV